MTERQLGACAMQASLADETPEGRSIVVLAKQKFNLRERELAAPVFVPFTAQTRMSGVDVAQGHVVGAAVRKGSADATAPAGSTWAGDALRRASDMIARQGQTPLAVADGAHGGGHC